MTIQKHRSWFISLFIVLLAGLRCFTGQAAEVLLPVDPSLPASSLKSESFSISGDTESVPALRDEITRLRDEITLLQQTLEVFMNKTVADLQAENDRLRQEVRASYKGQGLNLPNVPLPDKQLLEGLLSEPQSDTAPARSGSAVRKERSKSKLPENSLPDVPGGLAYEVISQWGRSPEEAAALSGKDTDKKATSLLGMVCVIAPGAQDENLSALARSLREQCEIYDNVNIEVFDDVESARAFNENKGANPQHRVLSISKHKASNRDVILLIKDGKTVEIPSKP